METIQNRCDKVTGFLNKREEERQQDIRKKKEDKLETAAEHEKIDFFIQTFRSECLEIENHLNKASSIAKDLLPNHFDNVSKSILMLQKYVANSNMFIRSYDVKICHQKLQDLTNKAKDLEEELLPKKKFGFKKKTKPHPTEPAPLNGHSQDHVDGSKIVIDLKENFCGFEKETAKTLVLDRNETFKKDVTLRNLSKCTVQIYGSPSTLLMNNLEDCTVLTGPVSTSIFVENCSDCKFVIACQQLRLHSSKDVDIYLHVTSRAIMEDCHQINLGPYNLDYDSMRQDFELAGLDMKINNWACVDDFNWLNLDKKSPNWSLMAEEKLGVNWKEFGPGCS